MSRLFIFNFDGTCNEPADAVQKVSDCGAIEDNSITNILKFHLLVGGSLAAQGQGWENSSQFSYYYAGIGTYGSLLQRTINALFSPEGSDVRHVLNRALLDFSKLGFDSSSDRILVTGFSRGAALARRFAKLISVQVCNPCIFEAVFDTVASINIPNFRKSERPKSEVVFENHSLPENVIKAVHLVSLDDKRRAFQPTLMNQEPKVTEVWFAGAHADVGGGYRRDGLSDVALQFFICWIDDLKLNIVIKRANHIDYSAVLPSDAHYKVELDDVVINPDLKGVSHEQDRWRGVQWLTMYDRYCCAIKNDKVTDIRPLVHWTVAERIKYYQEYKPESLINQPHAILYKGGEVVDYNDLNAHIESRVVLNSVY